MKWKNIVNMVLASALLAGVCPQSVAAEQQAEDYAATISSSSNVAQKVEELAKQCKEEGVEGEWEIALWMHDWLIYNANYDYTYSNYGPEGVLLNGSGVCQSYTEAYQLLLAEFSIESQIISSDGMDHAWNLVKIDGAWCHVDCTWDDPGKGGGECHTYFGLNDAQMSRDHYWVNEDYPESIVDSNAYYVRRNVNIVENVSELEALFVTMYELQATEFECYYVGTDGTFSLLNEVAQMTEQFDIRSFDVSGSEGYVKVTVTFGDSQGIDHTHRYKKLVIDPTCSQEGYTIYRCGCGDQYETDYTDTIAHEWGQWIVTKEPTESTAGEKQRTCIHCHKVETRVMEYGVFSGSCGENLTWELNKEGLLTISGNGDMEESVPWELYLEDIKNVVVESGVTSIGESAFLGCVNLTSVELPDSIKTIGLGAFAYCTKLTSIKLPKNLTYINEATFWYCTSLTNMEIPIGVTGIGSIAFENCTSLTSIELPNSITDIGYAVFYGCTGLKSIKIPDGVTEIKGGPANVGGTFEGCAGLISIELPDGITSIGERAFLGCSNLKSIELPSGVAEMGDSAFAECSSLENVKLASNLTSLGETVFYNCASLKSIKIPNKVTSIGKNAFEGCASLESISIPYRVTDIGRYAFYGCSNLADLKIGDGVTKIGWRAFAYCTSLTSVELPDSMTAIGEELFEGCEKLVSVEIPDTITTIEEGAFKGCKSLASVELPEGMLNIESYVFSDCSSLTEITIPDSVVTMGMYVLQNCSSLTTVKLPSSMKSISQGTFDGCESLASITLPNGITSIGDSAFKGCKSLKAMEIPKGVTRIGNYAFYRCENLTSIEIPSGVTAVAYYTFYGCKNLTGVKLPNNVTHIYNYAFYYCENLESIQLPSGVTMIGEYAFESCRNLKNIKLPSNLTSIGSGAFQYCDNLTSIEIPENVTSIGSRAFEDCHSLVSVKIPSGVTSIGSSAFYACRSLTKIALPEALTSIEPYTFYLCANLTEVQIPAGVTSIRDRAFGVCESLTDVYYGGTQEEWNAISIGSENWGLDEATIHFNSTGGDVETDITEVFQDVFGNDWFVDSVRFVYDNGMMSGDAGYFKPHDNMTRAMMVTTLYRLAGEPAVTDYTALYTFSDVHADMWYTDAVCWAYNTGVTTGYPDRGIFGTDDSVTREQLATFLYRYAESRNLSTTESGDLSELLNAKQVSSYAKEAMEWSVGVGLISGMESNVNGVTVYDLAPQGSATRAQLATILMRFCQYYKI